MLKQQLQEDLKQSMLVKDDLRTSTLRLLLSAINYFEIQKGGAGYEIKDEEVLDVIAKEVKKRNEAVEMYKAGNRQDLADKETREAEILKSYLPEQMNEEELRKIVDETILQTGASSMQDMGKVMGALMPKVKGKADAGMISSLVREKLSS